MTTRDPVPLHSGSTMSSAPSDLLATLQESNSTASMIHRFSPHSGNKRRKQSSSPSGKTEDPTNQPLDAPSWAEFNSLHDELDRVKNYCLQFQEVVSSVTERIAKLEAVPVVATSSEVVPNDRSPVNISVAPVMSSRHYRDALAANLDQRNGTQRSTVSDPPTNSPPTSTRNAKKKRIPVKSSKSTTRGSSKTQPHLVRERRVSVFVKDFINSITVDEVTELLTTARAPIVTIARMLPKNPDVPFHSITFFILVNTSDDESFIKSYTWPEGITVSRFWFNQKAKEFLTNRFKLELDSSP
ncbi:hypothetical protein SNEBB_008004 [Seison nebaliae]|nr:hypothetical protein SNEBB_008004 [Seison nebaliae]